MADYYVDDALGNDSNDGTSAGSGAWQSLNKITGALAPASGKITVSVAAGTYDKAGDYIDFDANTNAGTVEVNFAFGCTMDGTNANASASQNGIASYGTAGATLVINGNGLVMQNYYFVASSTNSLDTSEAGRGIYNDINISGGRDGCSSHGTSYMELNRVTIDTCDRSTFPMVDSSTFLFNDCTFTQETGALVEISKSATVTGTVNDCTFIFAASNENFSCEGVTFNRCIIGDSTKSAILGGETAGCTFNDCYVHGHIRSVDNVTMLRCYGRLGARVQGTSSNTTDIQNCVFADASVEYTRTLYQNFDPGDSAVFIFKNNIILDSDAFDNMTATTAGYVMTSGAVFHNNLIFGGSGYSANLVAADTGGQIAGTVTDDPLLPNADGVSTVQSDYAWSAGSPAAGAGTNGGDIGFSLTSVALIGGATRSTTKSVTRGVTEDWDWGA